ncbi:MAG: hypothetical protein ABR556_13730, partial [Pyrinomonadaceae bacterium]
ISVIAFLLLFVGGGALYYFFYEYVGTKSQPGRAGSSSASTNALSQQALTVTNDSLKSLRKVDAATQVGVSYVQYGSLLIDAQAQVNEALPLLPNTQFKNEIKMAVEAYNDAYLAWQIANKQGFIISPAPSGLIDSTELVRKYSLPPSVFSSGESIYVIREDALTTIWRAARTHIDRASSLLNQKIG